MDTDIEIVIYKGPGHKQMESKFQGRAIGNSYWYHHKGTFGELKTWSNKGPDGKFHGVQYIFHEELAHRYEYKHGKLHGTTVHLSYKQNTRRDNNERYANIYRNGKCVKQLGSYPI